MDADCITDKIELGNWTLVHASLQIALANRRLFLIVDDEKYTYEFLREEGLADLVGRFQEEDDEHKKAMQEYEENLKKQQEEFDAKKAVLASFLCCIAFHFCCALFIFAEPVLKYF